MGFLSGKVAARRVGSTIESLAVASLPKSAAGDDILEIAAARNLINSETVRRMAAENELRVKPLEYEAIFERSTVGKAQADPINGRLLKVNQALADMTEGLMTFNQFGTILYQNLASLHIHGYSSTKNSELHNERLPDTWRMWQLTGEGLPVDQWPISHILRGVQVRNRLLRVARSDMRLPGVTGVR